MFEKLFRSSENSTDDHDRRWLQAFAALGGPPPGDDDDDWILARLEELVSIKARAQKPAPDRDRAPRSAALVRSVKSLALTSKDPDALAAFYIRLTGLPLEKEQHPGGLPHWACQVGPLHFAIHSPAAFASHANPGAPNSDLTRVVFTIENLESFLAHLARLGLEPAEPPFQVSTMKFVALRDPDDRIVYFGTPWIPPAAGTGVDRRPDRRS